MSELDVDVAVFGGGVAGLAAAGAASRAGAAVALFEPARLGGRAIHDTLVPWRALADAVARGGDGDAVWSRARAEAARVSEGWEARSALRLEDQGVERVADRAMLVAPDRAQAGAVAVRFGAAVMATGGQPTRLGEGPRVLAPGQLLGLPEPPSELLVVGGGAAGAELASALSHLPGTEVTWLMDELGILPDFDRELAEALGDILMGRGIKLVHGKRVEDVSSQDDAAHAKLDGGRTYSAPYAVVVAGTKPRLDGLGLEAVGLEGLSVDEACRTKLESIYAAGECTPACPGAGAAEAMGRIAGQRAAGASEGRWRPERVARTVVSDPELAQIGVTPERSAGREVVLYTLRLEETIFGSLRGVGESLDSKGFLRVVCEADSGEVIGASGAGPGAIEAIGAVGLAMELGAKDVDLRRLSATLPGPLEALTRCFR